MPTELDNTDDLNRKYHNTFVLLSGELAYVAHFGATTHEGRDVLVHVSTGDPERTVEMLIDQTKIQAIEFNAAFINNGAFSPKAKEPQVPLVLVRRSPRRQWRRGLCSENVVLQNPISSLYRLFGRNMSHWQGRLGFPLLRRLLNPEYPTIAEAVTHLETYQAIAISPMFAIMLSSLSTEKYLLTSHFGFIGEISLDGGRVWVHHEPAMQELRDFAVRTNQLIHIEHAE
jgi:hypothetical protein